MHTKIRKWGNSLGLRIPKGMADAACVKEGSEVYVAVEDGDLVVRPTHRSRYRLDDLLDEVTDDNRHGEVETGRPVGREVW